MAPSRRTPVQRKPSEVDEDKVQQDGMAGGQRKLKPIFAPCPRGRPGPSGAAHG